MTEQTDLLKKLLLTKFLCCLELRTGGFILGFIDCLVYGTILVIFSLQLFFGVEFIDKEHGGWSFS